ncbi:hypothetical protein POTOM_012639 [Populus tomentosa]|uniref:Golgi SNAP receptor complex member 1 n=1 Tax=Populus tomentosa TaxID=118781 RepID=A0A8X8AA01_POPTO|nr:hypothetical protein POTOM_012639 [Populus tomentosa]
MDTKMNWGLKQIGAPSPPHNSPSRAKERAVDGQSLPPSPSPSPNKPTPRRELKRILIERSAMEVITSSSSSWDALRKQARKLEAQLDEQMSSFRKLASSKVSTKVDSPENDLESGIDRLLKQLQQVNSQMQAWVSSGGSEMVSHTLTRHQEILQDLTQFFVSHDNVNKADMFDKGVLHLGTCDGFVVSAVALTLAFTKPEFHRLCSGMRAKQEHALLLEDFREFDRTRLDLEDGDGSADQALLREHASISRNTGQMDNVISQAQSTLGTLVLQRSTFGGINSKLSNVSSRLPTVNQILSAIKRKKSMDTIIVSLVASVCTFLTFIYWLTK